MLIAGAVAIVAIAGGAYAWQRARARAAEQVVYRQAKATRGPISSTVLASGTVSPENRLDIKTPVAGRVEQVLIDEGMHVKKAQILGWMSSTERAALMDAAAAKGPAEVARWEELYKPTPILAPLNGMIIARNVESGQTVATTDAVFTMSDRLIVKAQVDETDLALIHLKAGATIVLDAYPRDKIDAQVVQIAYDAKTVSNVTTYAVDVLPKATPDHMRSGMTANVTFLVADRPNALSVPTEAISAHHGKFYLRVGTPEAFEEREIQTGITDGKRTEILEGLTDDEPILIAQLQSKGAGAGANPFSPMGRPPGAGAKRK